MHGRVLDSSRRTVVGLVDELWDDGAQGIILGCTELELLVKPADSELPLFLSTALHVTAALDRALALTRTPPREVARSVSCGPGPGRGRQAAAGRR